MFDRELYLEKSRGSLFSKIVCLDRVESTNAFMEKEPLFLGAVTAESQYRGRGRGDHRFFSPPGGLYISWAVPEELCPDLTLKAGAAALSALLSLGVEAEVKWLNDILYMGRKAGGILAKKLPSGAVLGMGFNLKDDFPPEIRDIAGALPPLRKEELAAALSLALSRLLPAPTRDSLDIYLPRCITPGRKVYITSLGREATALSVDGSGRLLTDLGPVFSGEAVIIKEEKP